MAEMSPAAIQFALADAQADIGTLARLLCEAGYPEGGTEGKSPAEAFSAFAAKVRAQIPEEDAVEVRRWRGRPQEPAAAEADSAGPFRELPREHARALEAATGAKTLFFGALGSNTVWGFAPAHGKPGVAITDGKGGQAVVNFENLRALLRVAESAHAADGDAGISATLARAQDAGPVSPDGHAQGAGR